MAPIEVGLSINRVRPPLARASSFNIINARDRSIKQIEAYILLSRLHKPAGALYLFLPSFFGLLLGALLLESQTEVLIPNYSIVALSFKFLIGSILVRSQGCVWNDVLDRDLDRHVARTKCRPMAEGRVSIAGALGFCFGLLALFLSLVFVFLPQVVWSSSSLSPMIVFLVLGHLYPLAKRITYFPQVVLGLCFSCGIPIAFEAMFVPWTKPAVVTGSALFGACVFWTVLYDSIYAAQDMDDDIRLGVKSTMVFIGRNNAKLFFIALDLATVSLLVAVAQAADLGPWFYTLSCALTCGILTTMIARVNLRDGLNCAWWFKNGALMVGMSIGSGLLMEYLMV